MSSVATTRVVSPEPESGRILLSATGPPLQLVHRHALHVGVLAQLLLNQASGVEATLGDPWCRGARATPLKMVEPLLRRLLDVEAEVAPVAADGAGLHERPVA